MRGYVFDQNYPNDTWETDRLHDWADHAISLIAQKAINGNADAAQKLAIFARKATMFLSDICDADPDLVRPLARIGREWPVIKEKRSKLSEDEVKLFKAIQLGADDFIENDAQTAKWQFDAAAKIAYSLIIYIREARGSSADSYYGQHGEAAKNLKSDFNKESAQAWWNLAENILLSSYPKLHMIDELNGLVPTENKTSGKKLCPSTRHQKILRKLKSRFLSFARNTCFD